MTTPAPHTPDEREYDSAQDAYESWLLAISELRRQHLARDTEEGREDEKNSGSYPSLAGAETDRSLS